MKNTRNFWPLGIAIFMIFMVCMIILTVYISIKFKPDDDNSYFSTRQIVDKEINDILVTQSELEKKYNFYIFDGQKEKSLYRKATRQSSTPIYLNMQSKLEFKVTDSSQAQIQPNSVKLYITRFADSKDDMDIGSLNYVNGKFISPNITFKQGNWKALVEFDFSGKRAYFEQFIIVK
ncbi:hypothetical protein [Helicobacter sp. MIT 14-3879]|uniref:hypothetical protein n=1 Tax=Helicobacter sp. MIT 14-3879 TaxID=2040649 RepID=UPI000E1F0825|nr:hypothetical protein [Helicobacter sp. MIT 14-3879]RDU65619.1 hypothetical protein CQA44_01170 [Helicobacter sp. MIT 14-3879]